MASISSGFIEQVRASTDIVSLVSNYVPLKATGKSFKGLCPFHQEKTPSFHVNPERQIFHCFGCDVGGDAFNFLMLYDKLSFTEAVQELSAKAGLQIPITSRTEHVKTRIRSQLISLNEEAAHFFQQQLRNQPEGMPALTYLKDRGLTEETIQTHGFGFAPDKWSALLEHLTRWGAKPELIVQAGLAIPRKSGQGFYDRFRNRAIIPIRDESARVVAFGGRILGDGTPKYLNSPDSSVYNKSALLYGFDIAKQAIRKEGFVILMEGYMDCIQAYQAGVNHCVACCGTSLTEGHIRLIRRYTDRVILNFDSDEAGQRAARRSIDLLLKDGLEAQVIELPESLDPDSFIRSHGRDSYLDRVTKARPFVDFLIQTAAQRYDVGVPRGKAEFVNEILPVLAQVPSRVERVAYVSRLAERAGISDDTVLDELRSQVSARASRVNLPERTRPVLKAAERDLIRWILSSPKEAVILDELEPDDLEGLITAPILRVMKEIARNEKLSAERVLDRLSSDTDRSYLTRIATEPSPLGGKQNSRDCLNCLRKERLEREMSRVNAKLEDGATDDDLFAEKLSLARRIESLKREETRI